MALNVFKNKEGNYLQWLVDHPNGFVVNTQDGNCSYFTLHKSSCRSVSKSNNPWGAFTERDYFKVCGDNVYELKEWFLANKAKFRGEFKICGICNPDDSAIFHQPLCLFPGTIKEDTKVYKEGAKKEIRVNAYERSEDARRKCLECLGYSCSVCGINFEEVYGDIGKNFIHVHHLKELSDIGNEYELNPRTDLTPVCPNCHAMLHQRKPCFPLKK